MKLRIRRWFNFVEHHVDHTDAEAAPLRKVAVAAVVENPYADRQVEDLRPMIAASEELGRDMGKVLMETFGHYQVQSYGKAGIAGTCGRAGACQCAPDDDLRQSPARGCRRRQGLDFLIHEAGAAWHVHRIPLASKDALYVRSHYDGMTVVLPDAPLPDEIAVIFCVANRGRIGARVGGLKFEDMKGEDGLV